MIYYLLKLCVTVGGINWNSFIIKTFKLSNYVLLKTTLGTLNNAFSFLASTIINVIENLFNTDILKPTLIIRYIIFVQIAYCTYLNSFINYSITMCSLSNHVISSEKLTEKVCTYHRVNIIQNINKIILFVSNSFT